MARWYRNPAERRRARWMGPAMLVLAGVAAGMPAAADVVEIPEWRRAFVAQGVTGSVAMRRLGDGRSFVSDLDGATTGLPPAATFTTPHLLIALETGVLGDLQRPAPADVRKPAARSAEPVFQTIARRIGEDRMAAWLARLGYGNASVAGGIDRFWLDGGLKVSPVQQLDFVERLLLGTLPASGRAQTAARDAVPGERLGCDTVLRGRTGWVHGGAGEGPDIGWWVGWIERPREVWLFAVAVEGYPERVRPARRDVTLSVLGRLGIAADGAATAACGGTLAALPEPVAARE